MFIELVLINDRILYVLEFNSNCAEIWDSLL